MLILLFLSLNIPLFLLLNLSAVYDNFWIPSSEKTQYLIDCCVLLIKVLVVILYILWFCYHNGYRFGFFFFLYPRIKWLQRPLLLLFLLHFSLLQLECILRLQEISNCFKKAILEKCSLCSCMLKKTFLWTPYLSSRLAGYKILGSCFF